MAYRVAQFAKLAGVTVRTLQYYDRQGLLKPSAVTPAGHRLYERSDLLRLQQILTLKWMGFPLSAIGKLLDDPSYDLARALTLQQEAVEAQIERLQKAAVALAEARELLTASTETAVSAETVDTTVSVDASAQLQTILSAIHPLNKEMSFDWQQYYSETAVASLKSRAFSMDSEAMAAAHRAWQLLYAAFDQYRHLPPESVILQKLAAQMHKLVSQFTQGDAEVRAGLENIYSQRDNFPPEYQLGDPELQTLMQTALKIYTEASFDTKEE